MTMTALSLADPPPPPPGAAPAAATDTRPSAVSFDDLVVAANLRSNAGEDGKFAPSGPVAPIVADPDDEPLQTSQEQHPRRKPATEEPLLAEAAALATPPAPVPVDAPAPTAPHSDTARLLREAAALSPGPERLDAGGALSAALPRSVGRAGKPALAVAASDPASFSLPEAPAGTDSLALAAITARPVAPIAVAGLRSPGDAGAAAGLPVTEMTVDVAARASALLAPLPPPGGAAVLTQTDIAGPAAPGDAPLDPTAPASGLKPAAPVPAAALPDTAALVSVREAATAPARPADLADAVQLTPRGAAPLAAQSAPAALAVAPAADTGVSADPASAPPVPQSGRTAAAADPDTSPNGGQQGGDRSAPEALPAASARAVPAEALAPAAVQLAAPAAPAIPAASAAPVPQATAGAAPLALTDAPGAWTTRLADEVGLLAAGPVRTARLKLRPAALGDMSLAVELDGTSLRVAIAVATPAAHAIIARDLDQLTAAVAQQGLALDRVTLELGGNTASAGGGSPFAGDGRNQPGAPWRGNPGPAVLPSLTAAPELRPVQPKSGGRIDVYA